MGVGGQGYDLATLIPGQIRYPLCRKQGGPKGKSEWVQKISPPQVLCPKTVQPVLNSITQMLEASVYFEDGRYLRNKMYKRQFSDSLVCSPSNVYLIKTTQIYIKHNFGI
jgi:hypothetical protein